MNSQCPNCGKIFQVDVAHSGRKGKCDECETKFIIEAMPAVNVSESASEVAEQESSQPVQHPYRNEAKKSILPLLLVLVAVVVTVGGGAYLLNEKGVFSDKIVENEEAAQSDDSVDKALPRFPAKKKHPLVADQQSLNVRELRTQLDQRLALEVSSSDSLKFKKEAAKKSQDKAFAADLALDAFIRKCGQSFFEDLIQKPDGEEFVRLILEDTQWQEQIMSSGPLRHPTLTVRYLYLIWKHGGASHLENPLYQQLATCVALEHAERQSERGNVTDFHVVQRFLDYVNAHKELRLHADFDDLGAWEMRLAIEMDGDDRHFEYHSQKYHYKTGNYMGTCWDSPYRLNNVFGDSIHGVHYYKSWDHAYCWPEMAVKVGGVCGTLSHYGASAARVHGLPAMAAGQPGHCAYIVRNNNNWVVTYSVTWPTGPKNSFWGWTYTHLALIEDAFKDPKKITRSHRLAWLGDRYLGKVSISPQQCKVFENKSWKSLPDFSQHKPVKVFKVSHFDHRKHSQRHDWIALSYSGQIEVPADGEYRLKLIADDHAKLKIDGLDPIEAIAGRDFTKVINLRKGSYSFVVDFVEAAGGDRLQLNIEPTKVDARVVASYQLATETAPLNYQLWRDYKHFLLASKATAQQRSEFCHQAAKALVQHQEAAWQLINDRRLFEGLGSSEKVKLLARLHQVLQQKSVSNFVDYPYDGVLNQQKQILNNDKAVAFDYFQKVLRIHQNSDRYFSRTLDWGQNKFANDANYKGLFNDYIAEIASRGIGGSRFTNIFKQNIKEASRTGNKENFQKFSVLASKILKKDKTKTVHPFGEIKAFPGYLLSAKGVLKISSDCKWDDPLVYRDVIANTKSGGSFHTDKENQPYAEVQLEGKGLLSGITVVNRAGFRHRQLPLTVQVSLDGKKWKTVFTSTKDAHYWNIDLAGKNTRATHVRVSAPRQNGQKEYFHLRGIFVYGKKLF